MTTSTSNTGKCPVTTKRIVGKWAQVLRNQDSQQRDGREGLLHASKYPVRRPKKLLQGFRSAPPLLRETLKELKRVDLRPDCPKV